MIYVLTNSKISTPTGKGDKFKIIQVISARPGLAQLVERLTHRYCESTSSNPSNLTSATVCADRTCGKPAAKRSACVAPEVDLRECTLHLPLQCE